MQSDNLNNEPTSETSDKKGLKSKTDEVFADSTIPKIYANSYLAGWSTSDIYVILQTNGNPAAVLNISYTSAKSLQQSLGRLISEFEAITDHEIMVMSEVKRRSQEKKDKQNEVE